MLNNELNFFQTVFFIDLVVVSNYELSNLTFLIFYLAPFTFTIYDKTFLNILLFYLGTSVDVTCNAGYNGGTNKMKCTTCTVRSVYTGANGHWSHYQGAKNWIYQFPLGTYSKWFNGNVNQKPTYTIGAKTFTVGDKYWQDYTGNHFRYNLVVDKIITNIWTDGSGTACAAYVPTCTPKVCTCPNGTPTLATGSEGTLCDTATEDCSECNAGFVISAKAVAGLSQICLPVKDCSPTQVPNSDQSAADSIKGMFIVGFFLLCRF